MPDNAPNPGVTDPARTYLAAQNESFARWRTRTKWIAYPIGLVAAIVTFIALGSAGANGAVTVIAAIVDFFIVSTLIEWVVMPAVAMPTVRCPYCSQQVPIAEKPAPLKPMERRRTCPSCNKALPQ